MNGKRFQRGMNLSCVDTETGESYWYACNLCGLLNDLSKENEQLRNFIDLMNMRQKWKLYNYKRDNDSEKNCKVEVGENVKSVKCEVFSFNTNCAKLYQIRSVSPNGVIRIGSKNYKVKWRMKDVREINKELPPRDEFNREEYNKLRNKYHTKNWYGDNVLGRIIYNIYKGTFGDYL